MAPAGNVLFLAVIARSFDLKNPSGFVPINFHVTGVLLLILGSLSLLCGIAAALTGWFAPGLLLILSVLLLLVGLYVLLAVPKDEDPAP